MVSAATSVTPPSGVYQVLRDAMYALGEIGMEVVVMVDGGWGWRGMEEGDGGQQGW